MNDFMKNLTSVVPTYNVYDISNSPEFKEVQRVGAENQAVSRIALDSTSSVTAKYIYQSILDFAESIDESYDVGLSVTTLGSSIQVYLTNLSFHDPHLIVFNSEDANGTKIKIVQHVTQLNYALVAMKKLEPDKPKRKIGFYAE